MRSEEKTVDEKQILCNVWNWYDGFPDNFKGSLTMIFYGETSRWDVNSFFLSIASVWEREMRAR